MKADLASVMKNVGFNMKIQGAKDYKEGAVSVSKQCQEEYQFSEFNIRRIRQNLWDEDTS